MILMSTISPSNNLSLINSSSNNSSSSRRYSVMRQEIIDAAQQIMRQDGSDGLSMRSIARRVKTSPANLYEYFLNKEEIIFSVYNETLHLLCTHLRQLEPTGDARADLFNLSLEYIRFIIQDPRQIQIVSHALQTEKLIQKQEDPSRGSQHAADPQFINRQQDQLDQQRGQEQQEYFSILPKDLPPDTMTVYYRENVEGIYELFRKAIDRCIDQGVIQQTTMTSSDIAHVLWALTHGLVTLSLQNISTMNQGIICSALDTFLAGLSRHDATAAG